MQAAPFDPEFWNCEYRHGRLRFANGSAEEKALARESHQLLHEHEQFFKGSRLVVDNDTMSVRDAIPTFQYYIVRDRASVGVQAFVKIMRQSVKLDAWPSVKTAFWLAVSAMQQQFGATPQITEQLIASPAFPCFKLCIGNPSRYGGYGDSVSEMLCDAVLDVLTTPETDTTAQKETASEKQSLELYFGSCETRWNPPQEEMELIEGLLDRIFQSPTLQFKVSTLDFTNAVMRDSLIEVAARIVAKCKSGLYQVKQIKMDGIIPWGGHASYYTPGDTPHAFRELASSASRIPSLPRFWSFQPPAIAPIETATAPSILQSISLSGNALTPNLFPQHFSTLRYGCPLSEDLTDYSADIQMHSMDDIKADCWRWLAFGLFYPRPKRFAQAYKLRTIGKLTIDPTAIRTIVSTITDPVAQLVYNDNGTQDPEEARASSPDCLMVCTVKEGASIEVFVSGVKFEYVYGSGFHQQTVPLEPWDKSLLETSEFEALCERDDGSVCVVVPGAGLGWVAKEDVLLLEREPLDLAKSALDGMYDMTIGVGRLPTPVHEVRSLFEAIGHQINSLRFAYNLRVPHVHGPYQFDFTSTEDAMMQYIQDHCTNLQRLRLDEAPASEISALVHALETSHLRTQLRTLNLNSNKIDDAGVTRLASALATSTTSTIRPALEELRVVIHSTEGAGIASIHDLLSVNRTLSLLELFYVRKEDHPDTMARYRERLDAETRLDEAFQGELLHNRSPMDVKLAFLSVASSSSRRHEHTSRVALPESVLSNIFGFTACIESRRTILWNPCMDQRAWR